MIDRLKQLRKLLGITQAELAEALNVSQSTVTAYETGNRVLTPRVISDICARYHVREAWLRYGEGEPFAELSRDQEISEFARALVEDTDDPELQRIQRSFVAAISHLSSAEWRALAKLAREWSEENAKDE